MSQSTATTAKARGSSQDHPVLARLLSANEQWAHDVERVEPGFFTQLATGQKPQVLWIGCSDSRVPESVLCAVPPGEIFVTRNVANQFLPNDDSANSVLAYAVDTVGVQHVIIAGHTCCGGAIASLRIASNPQPEEKKKDKEPTTALNRWLTPLIDIARSLLESDPNTKLPALVDENVKVQVTNVCDSPTIQEAWKAGKKVYVHGWVFEIETGKLRDLNISRGPESLASD